MTIPVSRANNFWIAPLPAPVVDVTRLPAGRIIIRPGDGRWKELADVGEFETGIYFENDGSDPTFERSAGPDRLIWLILDSGAKSPVEAVERGMAAMRAEGCYDEQLEQLALEAARSVTR